MRKLMTVLLVLTCISIQAKSQTWDFQEGIRDIVGDKRMTVGVAYYDGDTVMTYNNDIRFPLLSVFKLHVAVAALTRMQAEGVLPDDSIEVKSCQMHKDTYSPMLQKYADTDFRISIRELLSYSISASDNNAVDILVDYVGGMDKVSATMKAIGLTDFSLTETEATMHEERSKCFNNWSSPLSTISLIRMIFEGKILSGEYQRCLTDAMFATTTGTEKRRAGLPQGTQLAHKTGSSDRVDGIKIADNDAGAVVFGDGTMAYLAVFIMNSAENDTTNAAVIAEITSFLTHVNK